MASAWSASFHEHKLARSRSQQNRGQSPARFRRERHVLGFGHIPGEHAVPAGTWVARQDLHQLGHLVVAAALVSPSAPDGLLLHGRRCLIATWARPRPVRAPGHARKAHRVSGLCITTPPAMGRFAPQFNHVCHALEV